MLQLQIEQCHCDEVDELSDLLEEMGALSITLTDKWALCRLHLPTSSMILF